MKNFTLAISFLFTFSALCAQIDTTQPPYKRFPTVPPLRLLLLDSISIFTKEQLKKKNPVLIILFNPDCEHCQHEAAEMVKEKDELEDFQIVMATFLPFQKMKEFYEKYELKKLKNVVVGQDINFILPSFYQFKTLPYHAMYDKNGKLISTFEGSMTVAKLVQSFRPDH